MLSVSALRPDVPSFGYATILSISAASIWGGVYPYLPSSCRSSETTAMFYLVQMVAFLIAFCIAFALAWRSSRWTCEAHAVTFSVPLALGPLMLIAAMYVESFSLTLIVGAAALVGVGSAGFLLGWQRVFASMDAVGGTLALIKGTAFSAVIYFALCFIPAALTSYLIPLVMVPLAGLCLWLASQHTDNDQPMFEDAPSDHMVVYRNALRESFPVALSIGAFGFSSGAIRFIAVTHQDLLGMINIASMAFLLVVTVALLAVWRTRPFVLDLVAVFRLLLPVAGTCLVVLPFAGEGFTDAGFAITYTCFALTCMLMMMHCGQVSRDSGINPVLMYSFYAAVAYLMQTCGYAVGYASGSGGALGLEQLSAVAIVCLYVMLLVSLFGRRVDKLHTSRVEFLMLSPQLPHAGELAEAAQMPVAGAQTGAGSRGEKRPDRGGGDAVSLRCARIREMCGLSSREAEVMELIVRGNTGPAIAEMLFISENTMRTHSKRIYAKTGVHKKQELLTLVESVDLG